MQSHSLTLVHALAASLALACGGNSSKSSDSGAGGGTSTGSGGGTASSGIGGTGGTSGGNGSTGGGVGGGSSSGGASATSKGGDDGVGGVGAMGAGGAAGADSAGGNGGSEPTGVIGTLGEPCDRPGQLACAGNHQKLTLVCGGDGQWEINQTCPGEQICDTQEGLNEGTCQNPDPACANQVPGYKFCDGMQLLRCSADTTHVEQLELCIAGCFDAACEDSRDPCLDDFVNCADDCGGRDGECGNFCPLVVFFSIPTGPPYSFRTPSYEAACAVDCDTGVRGLWLQTASDLDLHLRVTVSAPWRLASDIDNDGAPCSLEPSDDCLLIEPTGDSTRIHVFTSDPEAAQRNVIVEAVDEDATCP